MSDSEPKVNDPPPQSGVHDSESVFHKGAKLSYMRENRDPVLTDFVRTKIAEWQAGGRQLQELAEIAGFNKSVVSQVKRGAMGVGAKTAPGFAKAFNFPDVPTMVDAAYEWRKTGGAALDELMTDEAVVSAVDYALGVIAGATVESLRSILAAFTHPRFRGRDPAFWIDTLARESRRDADEAMAAKAALHLKEWSKENAVKGERAAWREAAKLAKQAKEYRPPETPPLPIAEPEPLPKPDGAKKRHKRAG